MDLLTPTLPLIEALQKLHFLLPPAKIFSFLGNEQFFLLVLPLIYWCVNRQTGARLGVLLLFSAALNDVIKIIFAWPRPYWLKSTLALSTEKSFGFPSGHAQNAMVVWPFLALRSRSPRRWLPLALLLVVLIACSRLVLGVHFPVDLLGGAIIGAAILLLGIKGDPLAAWWHRHSVNTRQSIATILCLAMLFVFAFFVGMHSKGETVSTADLNLGDAISNEGITSRLGALWGLLVGLSYAQTLDFTAQGTLALKFARFVLGVLGIAICWRGLEMILPHDIPFRFLRYALTTLWVGYGAPWVFLKLKLMQGQETEQKI